MEEKHKVRILVCGEMHSDFVARELLEKLLTQFKKSGKDFKLIAELEKKYYETVLKVDAKNYKILLETINYLEKQIRSECTWSSRCKKFFDPFKNADDSFSLPITADVITKLIDNILAGEKEESFLQALFNGRSLIKYYDIFQAAGEQNTIFAEFKNLIADNIDFLTEAATLSNFYNISEEKEQTGFKKGIEFATKNEKARNDSWMASVRTELNSVKGEKTIIMHNGLAHVPNILFNLEKIKNDFPNLEISLENISFMNDTIIKFKQNTPSYLKNLQSAMERLMSVYPENTKKYNILELVQPVELCRSGSILSSKFDSLYESFGFKYSCPEDVELSATIQVLDIKGAEGKLEK